MKPPPWKNTSSGPGLVAPVGTYSRPAPVADRQVADRADRLAPPATAVWRRSSPRARGIGSDSSAGSRPSRISRSIELGSVASVWPCRTSAPAGRRAAGPAAAAPSRLQEPRLARSLARSPGQPTGGRVRSDTRRSPGGATLAAMTAIDRRPPTHAGAPRRADRGAGRAVRAGRRPPSRRSRSTRTGSSTASSPGCTSTSGCSSWPRTAGSRCSSGPGSWRSSPATSTSSSWSGSPGSSAGSRPGSRSEAASGHAAARGARGDLGRDPPADRSGTPRCSARRSSRRCSTTASQLVRWDDLDRDEQKPASGSSRSGSSRC